MLLVFLPSLHTQPLSLLTPLCLSKFLSSFKVQLESLHPEHFPGYSRSQFRSKLSLFVSPELSIVVYWHVSFIMCGCLCVLPPLWFWIPQGWVRLYPPATSSLPTPTPPRGISHCPSPGIEPPRHPGTPEVSCHWSASSRGERNCTRVTTWWSEGKGTLEPNHPGPNLSPVCFLPVWLWPSYLAKLSLSFLLSFMPGIVGARELCQHLVAICCYESWVNECSAGPQPGRQDMELVLLFREHLASWSFCQLWTHFPRLCLRALHPSQRLIVFLQPHPHIWLHLLI